MGSIIQEEKDIADLSLPLASKTALTLTEEKTKSSVIQDISGSFFCETALALWEGVYILITRIRLLLDSGYCSLYECT